MRTFKMIFFKTKLYLECSITFFDEASWGLCNLDLSIRERLCEDIAWGSHQHHQASLRVLVNIWPRMSSLSPHEDFEMSSSLIMRTLQNLWGRGHHCWVLGLTAKDFYLSSCPTLIIRSVKSYQNILPPETEVTPLLLEISSSRALHHASVDESAAPSNTRGKA